MSLQGRVSLLAVVFCTFVVAGAGAATNIYITFEEPAIAGSSTASGHAGEIEVLSWSNGFIQPASPTRSSAGAGTVEQATHANLTFTKYLDTGSTALLKYCWSGKQIGRATLSCYRSDGATDNKPVEYLKVVMEHVVISNYSISGGPGDIPVENISLDYGTIQYFYVDQKHSAPGPAVQGVTATGAPLLKNAASANARCSVKLASGKTVEVRSLNVTSGEAGFVTAEATKAEPAGDLMLTCGEGKATVALHGAKLERAGGKLTAHGGTVE